MKKILYLGITLFLGVLGQVILNRYLHHYGIGPHLLLLVVVCHGFVLGPLMGELLGFFWGLMIDAMGIHLFGLHTLLFSLAGYGAGRLRKRVAIERPASQIFVSIAATGYYFLGTFLIRTMLDRIDAPFPWLLFVLGVFFNTLIVMAVFWGVEWWVSVWRIHEEET